LGRLAHFDVMRVIGRGGMGIVLEAFDSRLRRHVAEEDGLTLNELLRLAQIRWHGLRLDQPDWADDSHSLACTFRNIRKRFFIHLMINAYWESLHFELPLMGRGASGWHRIDAPMRRTTSVNGKRRPIAGFGLHGSTEICSRSIRYVVNRSGRRMP
jgi:pullulanase/glycogen debranching enzyme